MTLITRKDFFEPLPRNHYLKAVDLSFPSVHLHDLKAVDVVGVVVGGGGGGVVVVYHKYSRID